MVFCCFRSTPAGTPGSPSAAVSTKSRSEDATAEDTAASQAQNGEKAASAAADGQSAEPRPLAQQHDGVMRVVALLQELLGHTSERMQVSKVMALLCQRLCVSWACLTALSADGEVFQHIGSAYALDTRPVTCSFSSCRTSSGLPQRGPPSRSSSTNSIIGGGCAVEVGMSDPHLLRGSDTSIEAAASSGQSLMLCDPTAPLPHSSAALPAGLSAGTSRASTALSPSTTSPHPLQAPQPPGPGGGATAAVSPTSTCLMKGQGTGSSPAGGGGGAAAAGPSPVSSWPLDWQLLYREKGLRSLACLPVPAANGSETIIGCLSLGSAEPLDWGRQFWASSTRLITGWAAGAITTTRATARASFYARLFGAADLRGLARAFAYDMPAFLSDGAAGPGAALPEVRLALVSSRLQHAMVYAAPLLQVSGRLGLPPPPPQAAAGALAGGGAGRPSSGTSAAAAAASGPSGSAGSGSLSGGLILYPGSGSGTLRLAEAERRATAPELPMGLGGKAAASHNGGGGAAPVCHSPPALHDGIEGIECMILGSTLDGDELLSCRSSSTTGGGTGAGTGDGTGSGRKSSVPGSSRPSSGRNGAGQGVAAGTAGGAAAAAWAPSPEVLPVDCVKINTDSTLLMSVLEAGDIMIIKDALQYFGGGRMVARDLALNNTRPATAGTLVILPLLHRCRSLGCVYVFARNEFNLSLSRAAWGDLAGMLSRAVFAQLVGPLRHEWYSVFSEEPQTSARAAAVAARSASARVSTAGGGTATAGRRVRRTNTAASLGAASAASSLRPSFDVPSRSAEPVYGAGGGGGAAAADTMSAGGGGGGGSREAAAAAQVLVAAAQVLEYAGFMPDADEAVAAAVPEPAGRTAGRLPSLKHRIPPAHASMSSNGEADLPSPTMTVSVPVSGPAGGGVSSGTGERQSPSPGSLSFKLPPELAQLTAPAPAMAPAVEPALLSPVAAAGSPVTAELSPLAAAPGQEDAQRAGGLRSRSPGYETPTTGASSCGSGVGAGGSDGGRSLLRAASSQVATAAAAAAPPSAVPMAALELPAAVAAAGGGPQASAATDELLVDGEDEVSGSSRELQGWPELVDILCDMHRTRNVSVYLAAYRGRPVAVKMMRSHMSMDGRPGHLDSEALTIAAQQQLSCVDHPNVLRVLMVYPLVYEVVAGGGGGAAAAAAAALKAQRHGGAGPPGALFLAAAAAAGGAGAAPPHLSPHANPLQGLGLGLGALHMQAHAMGDLLAGAGTTDLPGGGVYLTAVLPRREKFKRGLALMLELFPSLSLREVLQKRMLLPLGDPAAGQALGTGDSSAAAVGILPFATSQSALSDGGGLPPTPAGAGGAGGGYPYLYQQFPMLPTLPEALAAVEAGGVHVDSSSPGLAFTAASNSGNNAAGGSGSGVGGLLGPSIGPCMPAVLAILTQIAAGMAALHAAGLAHGELRPENVLLAMPASSRSHAPSGQQDRGGGGAGGGGGGVGAYVASAAQVPGGPSDAATPRASPPTPRAMARSGSGRVRSSGGGALGAETDLSAPERPQPGRPVTAEVIVKIKDAGMTVVGYSKGAQTVRKLLQRNRSALLPFLPPEVHRGERFSRSADVYMFGILMWELYTGGLAFSNLSGTPIKLLQTVIADGVRPLWPEGTPLWYQSLASRCWAGNPKQRPSFRRICDKLAEVNSASAVATAAAAAGWGPAAML